jgi:hypothetical protein
MFVQAWSAAEDVNALLSFEDWVSLKLTSVEWSQAISLDDVIVWRLVKKYPQMFEMVPEMTGVQVLNGTLRKLCDLNLVKLEKALDSISELPRRQSFEEPYVPDLRAFVEGTVFVKRHQEERKWDDCWETVVTTTGSDQILTLCLLTSAEALVSQQYCGHESDSKLRVPANYWVAISLFEYLDFVLRKPSEAMAKCWTMYRDAAKVMLEQNQNLANKPRRGLHVSVVNKLLTVKALLKRTVRLWDALAVL